LRPGGTALLAAAGRAVAMAQSADGMALPVVAIEMQPVSRSLLPEHELQWRFQP